MKKQILFLFILMVVSSKCFAFISDAFIGDAPNRLEVGTTSLIGGEYCAYERTLTGESSVTIFNKAQPRDAYILLLNYHPDYTDLTGVSINKQLWGYKPNNIPIPLFALAVSGGIISGTYRDTSESIDKFSNKTSLEFGGEASLRGVFPIIIIFPIKMSLGMYYSDANILSKYVFSFSLIKGVEFLISEWATTSLSGSFENGFSVNENYHYAMSGVLIRF